MKLRAGKTPVPPLDGEEHLGGDSSEDEHAPSPRQGAGTKRRPRAPGSLRITSAETKKIQTTLLAKFVKPLVYEDTILSSEQIAQVIAACIVGIHETRIPVFDKKRVLAQWKLILSVTWNFDLKTIKANQRLDKAKEAAVGLDDEHAKAIRERQGRVDADKEQLTVARVELSNLLVKAGAEIDVEHDVVLNTQTASSSFDSLLLGFKTLCALTSGHDQELFDLKESCEKTLTTLASKMLEIPSCKAYTESAGLSTTEKFNSQHAGELQGAGGGTTGRPGTKTGRTGAELDPGKLSLDQLTKTLSTVCKSAFAGVSSFVSRLSSINVLSEEKNPTPRKKAALVAPPSEEEFNEAVEARRVALLALIDATRALRVMQAKRNPQAPDDESVSHLSIIVPPHNHKRGHAVDLYLAQEGGDPITPLLEELLVHALAPESTRSHLEKSLHEKAKLAGRYNLGGLPPMAMDVAAGDEEHA